MPQHLKSELRCFKVVLWIMTDGKRQREEEGGRKEVRRVGLKFVKIPWAFFA